MLTLCFSRGRCKSCRYNCVGGFIFSGKNNHGLGRAAAKTFKNQCKEKKCKEKVLKAKESSAMKEGQRRGERVNSAQCKQNVQKFISESCGKVSKSGPSVMQKKQSQSSEASFADKRMRGARSQRGHSVPEMLHTQSTDPIQHLHSSYSTHACAAYHMPSP